jgi:hypothetical protein
MKNHFSCSQNVEQELVRRLLQWSGGFHNTAAIAFSGRQNEEKLLTGIHVFFIQVSHDP